VTQNSLRLCESFGLVRVGSVTVVAIGRDGGGGASGEFGHTVDEVALGGDDVVVALGAREVEDELLRLIETIELAFDGGEGAEKGLAEIGQDGGTARGDAVLDEKHGDLGEKGMDAGGTIKSRKQADESRGEIFVGGLELASDVAETEAGDWIEWGKTAAAAGKGIVAAAAVILGGYFG